MSRPCPIFLDGGQGQPALREKLDLFFRSQKLLLLDTNGNNCRGAIGALDLIRQPS